MVKKKRKIKQKRTDSQERPSVPATPEQVPLYIDVATPHDDERPAGIVVRPDSRRPDSGELVSGSIVGLASGEIHVDPALALAVHFDGVAASRKPSVEVAGEGAIVEEIQGTGQKSEALPDEEPTPAPLVSPAALQAGTGSMAETAKRDPAEDPASSRRRKRRNTLPQMGSLPPKQPVDADRAVVMPSADAMASGGYAVFSGEIEIVPETDEPPRAAASPPPLPPPVPASLPVEEPVPPEPPLMMGLPEESGLDDSGEDAKAAPPAAEAGESHPEVATPDETAEKEEPRLSAEELEAMRRAREERREQLRRLVASLPLPFAMQLPNKNEQPADEGFSPVLPAATPAAAMPPLESRAAAVPLPVETPVAVENPPSPPSPPTEIRTDSSPAMAAGETAVPPPAPETPAMAGEIAVPETPPKAKKVATPLENTLVSAQMSAMEPVASGRLPRASSRSDIPVKGFSDMEEEFFDKELHPENDYTGLDEVFASMQEQQNASGGLLGSLRRLFLADAPAGKAKNGTNGKAGTSPQPRTKGKNGKKGK